MAGEGPGGARKGGGVIIQCFFIGLNNDFPSDRYSALTVELVASTENSKETERKQSRDKSEGNRWKREQS